MRPPHFRFSTNLSKYPSTSLDVLTTVHGHIHLWSNLEDFTELLALLPLPEKAFTVELSSIVQDGLHQDLSGGPL